MGFSHAKGYAKTVYTTLKGGGCEQVFFPVSMGFGRPVIF